MSRVPVLPGLIDYVRIRIAASSTIHNSPARHEAANRRACDLLAARHFTPRDVKRMRALIDALEIAARSHGVANAAPSPEALLLGTWYARWTALAITAPSDLEPTPPSTLPGGPRMAAIARVA